MATAWAVTFISLRMLVSQACPRGGYWGSLLHVSQAASAVVYVARSGAASGMNRSRVKQSLGVGLWLCYGCDQIRFPQWAGIILHLRKMFLRVFQQAVQRAAHNVITAAACVSSRRV